MGKRLIQWGHARDVFTDADGDAELVADTTMTVTTEYTDGPIVAGIVLDPPEPSADALVGVRASTGFRKAIDDTTQVPRGSLAYLLLDDVPGATLVSGFAVVVAMDRDGTRTHVESLRSTKQPMLQVPDLCAGWQRGGVMEQSLDGRGRPPVIMGPRALSIETPTDEWAWHPLRTLPDDSMRRRRRIDVWHDDDAGVLRVDVFFRDSHMAPGGVETSVHEYTVAATVDRETMVVTSCEAIPHVLPWTECPQAAASARRLAGMPVASLRPDVRAGFVGKSTCTHLNDVLRGIEDVGPLAEELSARTRETR